MHLNGLSSQSSMEMVMFTLGLRIVCGVKIDAPTQILPVLELTSIVIGDTNGVLVVALLFLAVIPTKVQLHSLNQKKLQSPTILHQRVMLLDTSTYTPTEIYLCILGDTLAVPGSVTISPKMLLVKISLLQFSLFIKKDSLLVLFVKLFTKLLVVATTGLMALPTFHSHLLLN